MFAVHCENRLGKTQQTKRFSLSRTQFRSKGWKKEKPSSNKAAHNDLYNQAVALDGYLDAIALGAQQSASRQSGISSTAYPAMGDKCAVTPGAMHQTASYMLITGVRSSATASLNL